MDISLHYPLTAFIAHAHDFLCAYSGETAPDAETGDTSHSWPHARQDLDTVWK